MSLELFKCGSNKFFWSRDVYPFFSLIRVFFFYLRLNLFNATTFCQIGHEKVTRRDVIAFEIAFVCINFVLTINRIIYWTVAFGHLCASFIFYDFKCRLHCPDVIQTSFWEIVNVCPFSLNFSFPVLHNKTSPMRPSSVKSVTMRSRGEVSSFQNCYYINFVLII